MRYSTAGESTLREAQPFLAESAHFQIAVAHNGNLTNHAAIREELESQGSIFQSTMDSEVFVHLLRARRGSLEGAPGDAFSRVKGAYSLVMLVDDVLVAARDPYGFRPLSLGRIGSAWVVASETCAFDLIGATYERDVEPGEILMIRRGRLRSLQPLPKAAREVLRVRARLLRAPGLDGVRLQRLPRAQGARRARSRARRRSRPTWWCRCWTRERSRRWAMPRSRACPTSTALMRNHYVQRTFIEPEQSIRLFGVQVKHNPMRAIVQGKRLVVVEDSIVRGTTLNKLVEPVPLGRRARGARAGGGAADAPGPATTASTRRPRGADRLEAQRRGDPRADRAQTRWPTCRSRRCARSRRR